MKTLIVYSSKTGNTRKLAQAIHLALPDAELSRVELAPNPDHYDLILLGFWIENGNADQKMQHYMKRLKKNKVGLFATLGAYPDSKHAAESLEAATKLIPDCAVVGHFICQGAIDPELVEWMQTLPKDHGYGPTESRKKLWDDAAGHPDEEDLESAAEWALGVFEKQSD
jgi:flavodoxin